jgi:transposase-like protein
MPRRYPAEVRQQVIELARSGTKVAQLAATFGISDATIYNWLKQERIDRGELELGPRAPRAVGDQLGRHTADEGPREGEFAIDHADAAFALNLAKLLLAQTARVLARPPR